MSWRLAASTGAISCVMAACWACRCRCWAGSAASFGATALAPSPARAAGKPGGKIRVALTVPAAAIDPVTIADNGGLEILIQTGEFLCVLQPDLTLKPVLAESWSHDADGGVWTFKLRPNVKFHSGGTMKAEDVIASIDRCATRRTRPTRCRPSRASCRRQHEEDRRSDGGIHLDAPYGAFPYVISSDNYNCVILPASYKGDFEHNWDGTGPFKLEKYTPKVGASFVRNDEYWGPKRCRIAPNSLSIPICSPRFWPCRAARSM